MLSPRGACLVLVSLLAIGTHCARAQALWEYSAKIDGGQDWQGSAFSLFAEPDGGYTVTDGLWWMRFESDGSVAEEYLHPGRGILYRADGAGVDSYAPFNDGGLLIVDPSLECAFSRTPAGREQRAFSDYLSNAPMWNGANVPRLDGAKGNWAVSLVGDPESASIGVRLLRYGADCSPRDVPLPDGVNLSFEAAAALDGVAAYVIDRGDGSNDAHVPVQLLRVGIDGPQWQYPLDDVDRSSHRLFPAPDGGILWAVPQEQGGDNQLLRLDASGELLWTGIVGASPRHAEFMGDVTLVVVFGTADGNDDVHVFGAQGEPLGTYEIPGHFVRQLPAGFGEDSVFWETGDSVQGFGSLVIRPGVEGPGPAIESGPGGAKAQLADRRIAGLEELSDGTQRVWTVDASATRESHALPQRPRELRPVLLHEDAEGVLFALTGEAGYSRLELLDREGRSLWQRSPVFPGVAETAGGASRPWVAAMDDERVCVARQRLHPFTSPSLLLCMGRATGEPVLGPLAFDHPDARIESISLLPEDGIRLLAHDDFCGGEADGVCRRALREAVLSPDTSTINSRELVAVSGPGVELSALELDDEGAAYVLIDANDGAPLTLRAFDAVGATRWSRTLPATWLREGSGVRIRLMPGGTVIAAGKRSDGAIDALAVDANSGDLRWSRNVEPSDAAANFCGMVRFARGVLVCIRPSGAAPILRALLESDGATLWEVPSAHLPGAIVEGGYGSDDARFVRLVARGTGVEAVIHDADTGLPVAAAPVAPAGLPLGYQLARERLLSLSTGYSGVDARLEVASVDLAQLEQAVLLPVGEAGLRGTWYRPGSAGQGLYLDVLEDSGTVFGAWFTFDLIGGESPSKLRWYVLQGQIEPGRADVDLQLLAAAGGRFAAPPALQPEVVGSARLALTGCDRAQLHYRVDEGPEAGPPGIFALDRLTPAVLPCGNDDPAVNDAPSGAWFDPASSGQGLYFAPLPGGESAALWFTFDPEGAADDALAQHWFTLQPDPLAETVPGERALAIFQTIGGSFADRDTDNTRRVGSARLATVACDAATLSYAFDDSIAAGAFAGRGGELALERIGGCPTL